MVRRDVKRTELRLPPKTHEKFVEKCGEAGVDLNAAIVAFCEGIVAGRMTLVRPTAVRVVLNDAEGETLGVNEFEPHNMSKREAVRRIARRNGAERKPPG